MDRLAQPGDIMFERNIGIIASRRQELQIFSDGFVYIGFICGLDENWIQLYGHEEGDKDNFSTQWRFLLIGKENISAVGPTGRSIHDVDPETREWIEKKIKMFSEVSDKFLNSKGVKNDRKEKF